MKDKKIKLTVNLDEDDQKQRETVAALVQSRGLPAFDHIVDGYIYRCGLAALAKEIQEAANAQPSKE